MEAARFAENLPFLLLEKKLPIMLTNELKDSVERYAFGVCSYLGDRMNIASGTVRKYFIYTSFIAMGSPVIIYLIIAFWMNVKKYIRPRRNSIWD